MKANQVFFLDPQEESRFWSFVSVLGHDECWPWIKGHDKQGYGLFYMGHRERHRAHRVAWTVCFDLIPDGLNVLHECDNPPCCNPCHLFLGTHAENMADMVQKGHSTFCEKSRSAILTPQQVLEIRTTYSPHSGPSLVEFGERYGVSRETIREAFHGRTWNRLQPS